MSGASAQSNWIPTRSYRHLWICQGISVLPVGAQDSDQMSAFSSSHSLFGRELGRQGVEGEGGGSGGEEGQLFAE